MGRIIVPEWIFQSGAKFRKYAAAILSHELGHAIFDENLGLMDGGPFVESWRKATVDRNKAILLLFKGIKKLKSEDGLEIKSYSYVDLSPEDKRTYLKLTLEYDQRVRQSTPYQEVFSDLMAVLYSNNPRVNSETASLFAQSKYEQAHIKSSRNCETLITG